MNEDEDATITAWHAARERVIDPTLAHFSGRIVKHTGDGFLAEFATATDAVNCAVRLQEDLAHLNRDVAADRQMLFRMGINIGEITVDNDDIHGDGVNIAARLEGLADPGGVYISAAVHDHVHKKIEHGCDFIGERKLKNIAEPVSIYSMHVAGGAPGGKRSGGGLKRRRRAVGIGAAVLAIMVIAASLLGGTEPTLSGPPSIVVTPFRAIGDEGGARVFSEGLTEDLLTALSADPSVRVVTAAVSNTQADAAARVAAAGTQARYLLEGSVRGSGPIRITAQLIDTRTGFHLWGGRYDRAMADPLAQQAEISAKIVKTLTDKLTIMRMDQLEQEQDRGSFSMLISGLEMVGRALGDAISMPGELLDRWQGNSDDG
jgi:TolB-like protein